MSKILFKVVVSLCIIYTAFGTLEVIQDEELINLIKNEKYVIVLFSKRYCEQCDKYEKQLTNLREDLVDSLNAWVVKLVDSQLKRLYSNAKEPALVFFRHGIPLSYHGPLIDEVILHIFTNNKEPIVKELTDETFEHLTQAATGATTGDWFIMFYNNSCIDCQRLQASWEAVGAHLKSRMNFARLNMETTGAATARRFNVFHVPAFILLKQGKMYRYHIHTYDVKSFISFADEWYKNVKAENVPLPKTPFDDLTALIANYLMENSWLLQVFFGIFIIILVVIGYLKLIRKPTKEASKKKKANKEK